MSGTAAVIVAVVAAVAAPLVAYITASRKLSGKIGTSEASSLWEESAKIRDDYARRLAASDERQAALEGRVALLERDNNSLTRENAGLGTKILAYEQIIKDLNARLGKVEDENTDLRDLVAALQQRLGKEKG